MTAGFRPGAPMLVQMKQRIDECRNEPDEEDMCPVRGIMDRVGSKWSVMLIMVLAERSHRYGEIRRAVPDISQRMLTQTLRELQQDGLISRQVHPTTPPTVEYSLTSLGQTLLEPLSGLLYWAERHSEAILAARAAFAAAAPLPR